MKRGLGVLTIAVVALIGAASAWLLTTESGLQWAWSRVSTLAGGRIEAAAVGGRLTGPLHIDGLAVRTDSAEIRVDRTDLDWQPRALLSGRLHLERLVVQGTLVELRSGPETTDQGVEPPATIAPPLPVVVDHAGIDGLTLRTSEGDRMLLHDARLTGRMDRERLQLVELTATGPWGHAMLSGEAGTGLEQPASFVTEWRLNLPRLAVPLTGHGRIGGSLGEPRFAQWLEGPVEARLTGQVNWAAPPQPRWQLELSATEASVDRLLADAPPLLVGADLTATGRGPAFEASGNIQLTTPDAGRWQAEFTLDHDAGRFRLPALRVVEVAGPVRIDANARWGLAAGGIEAVELGARWEALRWPLTTPDVASPTGQLALSGKPDGYRYRVAGDVAGRDLPAGRLEVEGRGDLRGLIVSRLQADWLDGNILGDAEVSWAPKLEGRANLAAAELRPDALLPGLTGRVGFEASVTGAIGPTGPSAAFTLSALTGELNGQPLAGAAVAVLDKGNLQIDQLRLRAGTAELDASGRLAEQLDFRWQLNATRLARLHPSLAGAIRADGRVTGSRTAPALDLEASADALQVGPLKLASMRLAADLDLGVAAPGRLRLSAQGLTPPAGPAVERLELSATGNTEAHSLTLTAATDTLRLAQSATGRYQPGSWELRLHEGSLQGAAPGTWRQRGPAELRLGDLLALTPLCWEADPAAACIRIDPAPSGAVARTELRSLPAAAFAPLLPGGVTVTGALQADAAYGLATRTLDARARVDRGVLTYGQSDGQRLTFPISHGELTARADSAGVNATFGFASEGLARLDARLTAPDWPLGTNTPLTGRVEAEVERLDWIATLSPWVLEPQGRLQADITLSGPWHDPALSGSAELASAAVTLVAAGIRLEQIGLNARITDRRRIVLSGSARSGPGQVNLDGFLAGSPRDWHGEVTVAGERVEAVRLPQARVLVTPDLKLIAEPYALELSGEVRVPQAEINLPEFDDATVRASPDVVIVNGATDSPAPRRWKTQANVTLRLGDQVTLSGYGFEGRLGGQLTITERPGRIATAQGELMVVDGRYEAYGQELAIQQGRLVYVNTPITDPALDFRATREIAATNTPPGVGPVTAGIMVSGRLRAPELRLFSEPPMDDTNTLSYLVLGRPLSAGVTESEGSLLYRAALSLGLRGGNTLAQQIADQLGIEEVELESGPDARESFLVLGTHLSPRLYLQYAIGFAEAVNRLRIRYDLGGNWTLETESGEHTGTDLLYTIER